MISYIFLNVFLEIMIWTNGCGKRVFLIQDILAKGGLITGIYCTHKTFFEAFWPEHFKKFISQKTSFFNIYPCKRSVAVLEHI